MRFDTVGMLMRPFFRFPRAVVVPTCLIVSLLATSCSSLPPVAAIPTSAVALDRADAEAMISAYRQQHGLGAVVLDPRLIVVAQRQADAMAARNQLGHEVVGSLPERLAANGVKPGAAIENVSAGYGSFAAALGGWKTSPHHNENLLYAPMRRMGIAAAAAPGTRYKTFWSLVMTN